MSSMNTGGRLQKRYLYCLTSGKLANGEERIELHSGVSRYELGPPYRFAARSAEDPGVPGDLLKDLPYAETAVHFFEDYDDIITSNEEKRKRQEMLDELSAYIDRTYKEIREHGLYYWFGNDKNLLFNYKKRMYQAEQQFTTEVFFRTLINFRNQVYQTGESLLDERELLDYTLEELKNRLDMIIERSLKTPGARIPLTGEYTILLKNDPASVFVHESVGHLFEEDNFRRQTVFDGKILINPFITVTDYAHTAFGKPCLLPVYLDSEGTEAVDAVLIKDGSIQTRMNSRQFAENGNNTGNGRSSLFSRIPQIRMRNTALEVEQSLVADLSVLDNVLVVEKMNGGSSEQNGEVELFVEFGHEIKKGKTAGDIRNFVIRGNALDLLNSISAWGDDFTWHGSGCRKKGYDLLLAHGAPSIVIKGAVHGC